MPNFRSSPETSQTSTLRFLDQIDISIWACTVPTDETAIIDSIAGTFTSNSAHIWYYNLVDSLSPRRVTLNDLRRALLRDFGIENWELVMARYEDESYWQSQDFMLKLSYLDEIEGLKDQVKFRDKKALEDRRRWDEVVAMWEGAVAERDEKIARLEVGREGKRWKGKGKENGLVKGIEGAFSRFERSIEAARERFREELGIEGCGDQKPLYPLLASSSTIPPPPLLPQASAPFPKFPPARSVHWPTSSSLEKIFELPSPPRKRFLLPRTPLKPLKNTNTSNPTLFSPGVAFTKIKNHPVECDELLNEWDKELLLLSQSESSVSGI